MMNTKFFFSVVAAGVMSAGLTYGQEASSVERGLDTYMRVGCYECHGTDGQGNDAGPLLTPDPLPAEAIANFIRFSPGRMPVYPEEVLSDAEIEDIVAWLETVPPPPDADDIEILRDLKPGS